MILVEVEKEFVESFYYDLKDNFKNDIYLNPDEKAINFYISESNQPLIIKNLITRSPIDKRTERKIIEVSVHRGFLECICFAIPREV